MYYYKLKNKKEYDFLVSSFLAAGWKWVDSDKWENYGGRCFRAWDMDKKIDLYSNFNSFRETSSPAELLEKCGIKTTTKSLIEPHEPIQRAVKIGTDFYTKEELEAELEKIEPTIKKRAVLKLSLIHI